MSGLKFFGGLALAVLVHLAAMQVAPGFSRLVDVFVVVVVLHGLGGNSMAALLGGMLVGLVHDSLTNSPFGLFGFADTIVGYSTARLAQRLVIQRATGVLGLVGFAAAMQEVIVAGLAIMLLPDPTLPNPLGVAVRAGACGVIGMFAYIAGKRWRRSSESRQRNRMSRLRLG